MKLLFLILGSFLSVYSFSQTQATLKQSKFDSLWQARQLKNEKTIGKQFDQFSFQLQGKNFTNADLQGKVTFINFWFESCAPCIKEFDALNLLFKKFSADPDFLFVSFTFETPETIAAVREKYDLKFPVISIKREECYRLNQGNGFPTNIILNDKAIIKYLNPVGHANKEEANEYFKDTIYPKIIQELSGIIK